MLNSMNDKFTKVLFNVLLILTSSMFACVDKPTAPDQILENFPKTPFNIQISVGNSKVELTWDVADSDNVSSFKIFRNTREMAEPELIGTPDKRFFSDSGLRNGVEYFYQISTLSKKGFESEQSDPVVAIPNIFSIILNNGAEFTNSPSVTLNLTGPDNSFIRISNDPTLNDAQFEPLLTTREWQLSVVDGVKRVYAIFRDGVGNESQVIFDDIVLDTQAIIFSVSEDTQGRLIVNGESIHFTMNTSEANGNAQAVIENGPTIPLFDDGTGGDEVASDGMYERDYIVPFGLQTNAATVSGHFTDRAGNQAFAVLAPGVLTIQTLPVPVTLLQPNANDITGASVYLNWSSNTDSDFSEYKIFRADVSGVTLKSTLVGTLSDQSVTSFQDTTVTQNKEYFYRVFVSDTFGLSSGSNEINVTTTEN